MGVCRSFLTERSLRPRAVLAVALLLLGCQLAGGSLHAAGTAHDPEGECHFCLALDRVDAAVAPPVDPGAGVHPDDAVVVRDRLPPAPTDLLRYAIRAPPANRRS